MPKMWYDIHSVVPKDDDDDYTVKRKTSNKEIIADKKPYFMIYVYPQLRREVRRFVKTASKSCRSQFGLKLEELLEAPDKTEQQEEFVKWYYKRFPAFDENGVMNRLCHYVEREFNGFLQSVKDKKYPYRKLLAGSRFDTGYIGKENMDRIKELFRQYKEAMQSISVDVNKERIDPGELTNKKYFLDEWFVRECDTVCVSKEWQCDILLKLCYSTETSKRFVWKMCGEQIVRNLLSKNKQYSYFVADGLGDTVYGGNRYKKMTVCVDKGG